MFAIFQGVATMAISDANKRLMLHCDGLIGSLIGCLLLGEGNKRRTQDGAEKLQEEAAGTIHELSLFKPWLQALKDDGRAMGSLREVLDVGTKKAQESAAAALFELDDQARADASAAAADDGSGTGVDSSKPPPHIMMSYNWDHQDVILRVVAWLQTHGYLVWVDTEQMKGSTVDTMALAVEGSEVMLIGVSRAYKESSNCRMEAQYGLQKKKALIPLMMQEGYCLLYTSPSPRDS